jgi:hypothetical protein
LNYAPGISAVEGAESKGYQREQKAYSFSARSHEFSFTMDANQDNPLHNPSFEIENWNTNLNAELSVNSRITFNISGAVPGSINY